MKKKAIFFYGVNLLVTLVLAILFGGVLFSIKGNELILSLFITMGVQLSLFVTTKIYNKKYNNKRDYNYKLNKYSILSVLIPIIIFILVSLLLDMFNIKYEHTIYEGFVFIIAIITTILGSIFEEIGWRGTFLKIFEEKYTPFVSSIMVGLLWGIWHFFKISSIGIISYLIFILSTATFSVIMCYLYHKSNKSLLNPILFHIFINLSSIMLIYNRECKLFYLLFALISLIIVLLIYLFDKKYFILKK